MSFTTAGAIDLKKTENFVSCHEGTSSLYEIFMNAKVQRCCHRYPISKRDYNSNPTLAFLKGVEIYIHILLHKVIGKYRKHVGWKYKRDLGIDTQTQGLLFTK